VLFGVIDRPKRYGSGARVHGYVGNRGVALTCRLLVLRCDVNRWVYNGYFRGSHWNSVA